MWLEDISSLPRRLFWAVINLTISETRYFTSLALLSLYNVYSAIVHAKAESMHAQLAL